MSGKMTKAERRAARQKASKLNLERQRLHLGRRSGEVDPRPRARPMKAHRYAMAAAIIIGVPLMLLVGLVKCVAGMG